MRRLALIAALTALVAPALAQVPGSNIPRTPQQMEQEQRIYGHGFEQMQRQNPQLYPYAPSTPPAAAWTPQYGFGGPPANAASPPPQARAIQPPIPPQTHLRPRPQVKPPAISPQLPPEELPPRE